MALAPHWTRLYACRLHIQFDHCLRVHVYPCMSKELPLHVYSAAASGKECRPVNIELDIAGPCLHAVPHAGFMAVVASEMLGVPWNSPPVC